MATLIGNFTVQLQFTLTLLGVLGAVKNVFSGLVEGGLPNWTQKAVSLAADGASVNLGVRNDMIELLKAEAGNHVIPFHCLAHR